MKKILYIFLAVIVLFSATFFACKKEEDYTKYLTELRSDVFLCNSSDYKISASYGFRLSDSRKSNIYSLTFKLLEKESSSETYTLSLNYNDTEYENVFTLNNSRSYLTVSFNIDNFTEKQFTAYISVGSNKTELNFYSSLPENTLTYNDALKVIFDKQRDLLNTFFDENGNFTAELILRVSVKKEKPYWYVGINDGEKLKAFLLDGKTGELLAIREIF